MRPLLCALLVLLAASVAAAAPGRAMVLAADLTTQALRIGSGAGGSA